MTRWIRRWTLRHSPTPEKAAVSLLINARMELFTAEQRVIDANIQREYWRARVQYLEEIRDHGIGSPSQPATGPAIEGKGQQTRGPRLAGV